MPGEKWWELFCEILGEASEPDPEPSDFDIEPDDLDD